MRKIDYIKYFRIPFKEKGRDFNGVDCYGLVFLFLKEEFGIVMPDYLELDYKIGTLGKDGKKYIERYEKDKPILSIYNKVDPPPKPFDILVFKNVAGIATHIAIYIGNNKILHTIRNRNPSITEYNNFWKNRLYGIFRIKELERE